MYNEINEQGVLLVLQDLEEDKRRRAPFAVKLIYSLGDSHEKDAASAKSRKVL